MNISGMISGIKNKIREREDTKANAVAHRLATMKKERTRAEGHKKIYDLQAQEKAKLAKAKADVRKQRFQGSVLGKVSGAIDKGIKAQKKKKKGSSTPFLPSGKDHPMFRK